MGRSLLGPIMIALVLLFAALESEVYAATEATDPATDYVVETQSTPGAAEAARCLSGPCKIRLVCPTSCKQRSTIAPGKSACFIDCQACSATCKHRKPNCYGFGAICYDPRFVGGDGVVFHFHGQKDKDFCIVSDRNLHVNAHFIGNRPKGRTRDYTWVQGLGIIFGSHKLTIGAKEVRTWYDEVDQFTFSYDGVKFSIPQHDGAVWTSADGHVVIERLSDVNSAHVTVDQLMEVSLDVVPVTDHDSRVHNYHVTDENRFAHLQMQFHFLGLSSSVDGVLGQTYRPNFKTPVNVNSPIPVMGGEEKYLSSSMLSTDCKVSQFSVGNDASSRADASPIIRMPTKCSSEVGGGISCRR